MGELYELALVEWHVTPEEINNNWTEELLQLMLQSRKKRFMRMLPAAQVEPEPLKLSNEDFFRLHGQRVKTIKVGAC